MLDSNGNHLRVPSNSNGAKIDLGRANGMMYTSQKLRHIVAQKNAKTPMQVMHNPLNNRNFEEHNNSQRDGLSDHSEDDLFFLDEYFKNTPTAQNGAMDLTHSNGFR